MGEPDPVVDSSISDDGSRRIKRLALVFVAVLWLAAARLLAYYGVLLLPKSVASQLTLHSYLSLVLVVVTTAGVTAVTLAADAPRRQLGLTRPAARHVAAGLLGGPIVLTISAYIGFRVALPTLLSEIAAGGKRAAESNTGEFGRALVASAPATTLLWAVVLTPLAEELLFRGALWSAVTRFTAPRKPPDGSASGRLTRDQALPRELLDESALLVGLRHSIRLLRDGGIATLITAAVFAAMHADMPGGAGIVRVTQTACLGLALGVARHATGSIVPGMALHAVFNLLTIAKLRKWLTSPGWPPPLPVPSIWWQIAAVSAALLATVWAYRAIRHRKS